MIELRPFATLGGENHGWLDAKHHFSFANYYDPKRMNWGNLRVWNDDVIEARSGFPPHPHRDMEIITYVRTGAITHQDSMGNKGRTAAGDVQVMSAGTGVQHAEYNLEDETTTLFQIWVLTDRPGATPSWGAAKFPKSDRSGRFVTLASGFAEDGDALKINSAARVMGATLAKEAIPLLPGVERMAAAGLVTGASGRNWAGYGGDVDLSAAVTTVQKALLTDPQTSGGLLVACAPDAVEEVLAIFRKEGFEHAAVIGETTAGPARVAVI